MSTKMKDYKYYLYGNNNYSQSNRERNFKNLVWLHEQLTHHIDLEFDLLGQRLNILVTGNAFLFTSTAIALGASSNSRYIFHLNYLVPAMVLIFLFFGIAICYMSLVTMNAARKVIREKKEKREIVEEYLKNEMRRDGFSFLGSIAVHYNRENHRRGHLLYKYLPKLIIIIWVFTLIFMIVFHSRYYNHYEPYIQKIIQFFKL